MPLRISAPTDGPAPDVICAQATPEGSSALAIIRVSGRGSFDMVEKIMAQEPGRMTGMRRSLGSISIGRRIVDEVVAFSWPAERSYTGEDLVEITCHGVPGIIREILDILLKEGARKARPGEFTERAFISGKLSAMDVIALASKWDILHPDEDIAGEALQLIDDLRSAITRTMEVLEGEIEFGEVHSQEIGTSLNDRIRIIENQADRLASYAARLQHTQRVFIMGPVNSGKSTLFNLLTGDNHALVSETPGTTREGRRGIVEILGRTIELCDTAGSGGQGLDALALENSMREIGPLDRILWMSDENLSEPSRAIIDQAGSVLNIRSKSDLIEEKEDEGRTRVSCVTGEGISEIEKWIAQAPGSRSLGGAAERIILAARKAERIISSGDYGIASEILSEAEREVTGIIGNGHNILLSVERALSTLCVGK